MAILSRPLRRQLESAVKEAREFAEEAASEALSRLGVADPDAVDRLSDAHKALRRRLRAHGRTLGDTRDASGGMTTIKLQDAAAYELWHRMLFGRFLAERRLLIHPELGVSISVTELRELAKDEGGVDEWALAEQYAAPGLPGVFKPNDPVLALPIAPEFSKRLRTILSSLPEEVFAADDSLGWTYQFWRASEKDAVNQSGVKIGAAELPAVTQLFTEPYMVKFLLHNSLGAWWAGKVLEQDHELAYNARDEAILRDRCSIPGVQWEFLRFVRDDSDSGSWRPAAGTFPGWPKTASEITYCDPCCGSGHFLVEAFLIITALRMQEEQLRIEEAAVKVLVDNLHGLELDGRCVQIAAFNVALAAWTAIGKPVQLPSPNIAWVGAPPPMPKLEMAALANEDDSLRSALSSLHDQFVRAPILGSLATIGGRDLFGNVLRERGMAALARLKGSEPERAEGAFAARGLLDASAMLAKHYVLLATNVPFLGRGKQAPELASYIATHMPEAKGDLATAMLQRIREMAVTSGAIACVTPQNWLFLSGYARLRQEVLSSTQLCAIAMIGEHGFESSAAAGAFTSLIIMQQESAGGQGNFSGFDANEANDPIEKALSLRSEIVRTFRQADQLGNPDYVISFTAANSLPLLGAYASSIQGLGTSDNEPFIRFWWEFATIPSGWRFLQSAPDGHAFYRGLKQVICWENGAGRYYRHAMALKKEGRLGGWRSGGDAWGKLGISVSEMRDLPFTNFLGEFFDNTAHAIIPNDPKNLPAIWCFLESGAALDMLRASHRGLKVSNHVLLKIPFDINRWSGVAEKKYSTGLPEPSSDDPAQWLFHGHPAFALDGAQLHVALARIAGYRWPAELDRDMRLSRQARERAAQATTLVGTESDGILLGHAYGADLSLANKLRIMLGAAFGATLSLAQEQALVRAADMQIDKKESRDLTIEGWLNERAFRQHCILFDQRPFLWHIWDGLKDGFSAFLNYHGLDRSTLERLTFTLLGDWIRVSKAEGNNARVEKGERLQQSLMYILEGEAPFDIFIRWKSLSQQPVGWEPDLADGVRLNIRPFMTAGILREQPKGISWNKDRGTDVATAPWFELGPQYGGKQGDRINDHHTTLTEKRAARVSHDDAIRQPQRCAARVRCICVWRGGIAGSNSVV